MLHGPPKTSAVDCHEAAYIVGTRLDRLRNFAANVSAESVKGRL